MSDENLSRRSICNRWCLAAIAVASLNRRFERVVECVAALVQLVFGLKKEISVQRRACTNGRALSCLLSGAL